MLTPFCKEKNAKGAINRTFKFKMQLLALLLSVSIFFISGFGGSYIDTVKTGILGLDKSTTVGNALDNYKFFKNKKWSSFEDSQKRKIVQFEGILNQETLFQSLLQPGVVENLALAGISEKNLKQHLNDKSSSIYTTQWTYIIQFKILHDNNFEVGYIGFKDREGKEEQRKINTLQRIYENLAIMPNTLLLGR